MNYSSSNGMNQHQHQLFAPLDHCGYPSKHCENVRAVKCNGELHRFCDHHRAIANRNQQRLQQRRRLQKSAMLVQAHQMGHFAFDKSMATKHHLQTQQKSQECQLDDLSEEDLRILEALLTNNDIDDATCANDAVADVDGDFPIDDCPLEFFAMDVAI